jgi:NAD+ diphosphatase
MTHGFIPSPRAGEGPSGRAWWFLFSGSRLLVRRGEGGAVVPSGEGIGELGLTVLRQQYLGTLDGLPCYAAEVDGREEAPSGMAFVGLRTLFGQMGESFFGAALTAVHLVEWDRTSLFCGRCGAGLTLRRDVRAKECGRCGLLVFPRISPAVIVLVERGDLVLLARAARFTDGFYSVLAGFVEPGESLEEAVSREVEEETAITVKDIQYFGSQPWPFPDSLMVAFTARYAAGEIRIDGNEILDGQWFTVDNLPMIPGKISIARRLIDWFVEKHGRNPVD